MVLCNLFSWAVRALIVFGGTIFPSRFYYVALLDVFFDCLLLGWLLSGCLRDCLAICLSCLWFWVFH